MRQAYDRLGDIVLVIDNGAGDFIPLAFECCDRSDFGHAPNSRSGAIQMLVAFAP